MLFQPRAVLEGQHINLKRPTLQIATANQLLNAIDTNRKFILPWFQQTGNPTYRNTEDAFCRLIQIEAHWINQTLFTYFIYTKENKLIGLISAQPTKPENCGLNLHFWITKKQAHQGFMKEAIQLIEKEFFFLGTERIMISCDIENAQARLLATHSGYKLESKTRHGYWNPLTKKFHDLYVFAKIKES